MIGQQVGAPPPQQMQQQPGAAPQDAVPDGPDREGGQDAAVDAGDNSNVTPEEQAQYDQFVKNGLHIIYATGQDSTVNPPILAHLKGEFGPEEAKVFEQADPPLGQTPNDNLAATCVLIVLALDASATQAQKPVDDAVVLHGGIAILEELATVSQAANIHDYSEGEMEAASYRAMDLFRVTSPRVDQESLKQQFGQIVQADKDGSIDKLLPGIGNRIKEADQQEQQQPPADQAQAPAAQPQPV